jgi:hypothetical protein
MAANKSIRLQQSQDFVGANNLVETFMEAIQNGNTILSGFNTQAGSVTVDALTGAGQLPDIVAYSASAYDPTLPLTIKLYNLGKFNNLMNFAITDVANNVPIGGLSGSISDGFVETMIIPAQLSNTEIRVKFTNNKVSTTASGVNYVASGINVNSAKTSDPLWVVTTTPNIPENPWYAAASLPVTAAPSITTPIIDTSTNLVDGTGEANASIELFAGASSIGTGTANGSGVWSITITPQLLNAVIGAKATASGKTISVLSTTKTVQAVGLMITSTPVITTLEILTTTNLIEGTSEPNSVINLRNATTAIGSGTANASGIWSITIPYQAVNSSVTANATAPGKSVSLFSGPKIVTLRGFTPTPTIVRITPISINSQNTQYKVLGVATSSATISLFADGLDIANTITNPTGNWEIIIEEKDINKTFSAKAQLSGKELSALSNEYKFQKQKVKKQSQKLGICEILAITGILFGFVGFIYLLSKKFVSGILSFLLGVLAILACKFQKDGTIDLLKM